jgi:FdhE protein
MRVDFDRKIARAADLQKKYPESEGLLSFYIRLARFQNDIFEALRSKQEIDIGALIPYYPVLAKLVRDSGPESLQQAALVPLNAETLAGFWDREGNLSEEEQFFARVLVQPYAEYLSTRGTIDTSGMPSACPFCSAKPSAGVLRGEGDGAKRSLLCSVCATEWPYRRILCANCGEEDKEKLPIYTATGIEHVHVEACDHCQTYIKSVDLTRDGHSVPVVDEIATVTLNIWADEHGYFKLETNILGM